MYKRIIALTSLFAVASFLIAPTATSAAPQKPTPSCAVELQNLEVLAGGLPIDTVINILVFEPHASYGWVLGTTPDGNFIVPIVQPAELPTTYKFVGRTRGNNGAHYKVFATCSTDGTSSP